MVWVFFLLVQLILSYSVKPEPAEMSNSITGGNLKDGQQPVSE